MFFSRLGLAVAAVIVAAPPILAETSTQNPPALGADASQAEKRAALREFLFTRLKAAGDASEASDAEREIWDFWYTGPDAMATRDLERARQLMRFGEGDNAEILLGEIIERHPSWAEPYNQRAILNFFREKFEASLADIAQTLDREPKHFGALSGSAQIYFGTGRPERGLEALRLARDIHPWLGGRSPAALTPEGGQSL